MTCETLRILGELYGKEDRAEELTTYLHGMNYPAVNGKR